MGIIDGVYSLAQRFVESADFVEIREEYIDPVSASLKGMRKAPKEGPPNIRGRDLEPHEVILWELTACSVDFCYWYGRSNVRPGNAGSGRMLQLLGEAWENAGEFGMGLVETFVGLMNRSRFPLITHRRSSLNELLIASSGGRGSRLNTLVGEIIRSTECEDCPVDMEHLMDYLIFVLPGFGQDQFLKRASLFFNRLHERMGWFKNGIGRLPIPADYQVPKVLRHLGVLRYDEYLSDLVDYDELLLPGSGQEIEIRAASIIAAHRLAERAGVCTSVVDDFLWLSRNEADGKFHLCVTTDY
jgi:hypothetical protein